MKLNRVPSLYDIAITKVSVVISCNVIKTLQDNPNDEDKFGDVNRHWFLNNREKFNKVIENTFVLLQLPKTLKTPMVNLCKNVYNETSFWNLNLKYIYREILPKILFQRLRYDQVSFNKSFQWKSDGLVDEEKTIKTLIENEELYIGFRFVLACCFCFKGHIFSLWNTMPDVTKLNICKRTIASRPLVCVWLKILLKQGTIEDLREVFQSYTTQNKKSNYIFHNVTMLQYFIQVCTRDEKSEILINIACKLNRYSERVMRFCLFEISEKQCEVVFKKNAPFVLISFLEWPWQQNFMILAHHMWNFIGTGYCTILKKFRFKLSGPQEFDYAGLLMEFWHCSPEHLKEEARERNPQLMSILIYILNSKYKVHNFY